MRLQKSEDLSQSDHKKGEFLKMAVEGLKSRNIEIADNKPKEKVAKVKAEIVKPLETKQYAASKIGESNLEESLMKHKVQTAAQNGTGTVQAFAQPTTDPYRNQTADQIAENRIEDYNNASSKQDSAEETGRLIIDIARHDPAKARLVSDLFDNTIENGHRDELAQEAVRAASDADLAEIASTEDGQKLLAGLQEDLLDSRVHDDEAIDADRIRKALDENGIFLGSEKGAYPTDIGESILNNEDAAAEDVANFIKYNPDNGRHEFIEALHLHEGDAEWLSDFYSALGSEKVGELINETVEVPLNGTDPEFAIAQTGLIRDSLETLVKSGDLTQAGMDSLVNNMNAHSPYIATEIFGKSVSSELKEMFVNSAIANGDDNWDSAALHVLNGMNPGQQAEILSGLSQTQLNNFIEGAMATQQEIPTFSDAIRFGIDSYSDIVRDQLDLQTYGGVEKLLDMTSGVNVPYPPYRLETPFSEELQTDIFGAVANGLNNDKAFENMSGNVEFKENLAKLFIQNRDQILESYTRNNDLTEDGVVDISKFVELTLFTPPLGDSNNSSLDRLPDALSGLIGELTTDARDNGNTTSARLAGRLLGAIDNAAERASKRIADDKAARDKFIDTVVGFAFDLIPFPGVGKLGKGGSELLQRAFKSLEGILKAETLGRIENMTAAEAKAFLASELKGNDELRSELQQQIFSDLFTETVDQLGVGIDAETATEIRTIFETAYTTIDNGNEGNNPRFE